MTIRWDMLGVSKMRDIMLFESCETRYIVTKLEEYQDLYLPEPQKNWDREEYKKRVYERAVIDELVMLTRLNPDMDIYEVIGEFMDDLEPGYNDLSTPDEVFEILYIFMETLEQVLEWFGYSREFNNLFYEHY